MRMMSPATQAQSDLAWLLDRAAQASFREEIACDTGLHITAVQYAHTDAMMNMHLLPTTTTSPDYIAAVRAAVIKEARDYIAAYAVREQAYQKRRRAELKARRSEPPTPPTRTQPARRRGGDVVVVVGRGCPPHSSSHY